MASEDSLKNKLSDLAKDYAGAWQRLPESLRLPEPLPVKSILRVFQGSRELEEQKESFDTPQAAIEAALERGAGVVLVEAGPGQGKTSALFWAAHLACKYWLEAQGEGSAGRIPWYHNLGRLLVAGNAQDTLKGILEGRPKVMCGKPGLLFLDGLDLLTKGRPDPDSLVTAARISAEDDGHCFVLSGRPLSAVRDAVQERGLSYRIELAGLDQEAVDRWLDEQPNLRTGVDRICQANAAARDLRDTPLLFAMVVSAAIVTTGGKESLKCDRYPGRAGLFAGFIDHFVERSKGQKHLGEDFGYSGKALEGLCWAALTTLQLEKIPGREFDQLLGDVLTVPGENKPPMPRDQAEVQALSCVADLRKAGVVLKAEPDRTIRFIHQEFMEHLGGRHLARRLKSAEQNGWLDVELWDHLKFRRLDSLLFHSLAQVDSGTRPAIMTRVFYLLKAYDLRERVSLLTAADLAIAMKFVKPFLKDSDDKIRLAAVKALGVFRVPQAAESLIIALKDQSFVVRETTALMLGELKAPQAVQPLIITLKDNVPWVREAAAVALGNLKARQAVEPLIETLQDLDDDVRRAAARALGAIKDIQAVRPLMEAFKSQDHTIRSAVAKALTKFEASQTVNPLMAALKDQDNQVRQAATEALGNHKARQAVKLLIDTLQDLDNDVRRAAAQALGNLKAPQAVEALVLALKDEDTQVRSAAAQALGEIKDSQAAASLMVAIRDQDKWVRWAAAEALGELKAPQAVKLLIDTLQDLDNDVRRAAAQALGILKAPQAVEALVLALKDEDTQVRSAAAQALGEIKAPWTVIMLVEALENHSPELRGAAAEALGVIRAPEAVEPLISALKDQNSQVRRRAVWALGKIKDPQVAEPLMGALRDQDRTVRWAAVRALGAIKDPQAVEPLMEALKDQDIGVRSAAAQSLGESKDSRAVKMLTEALQDRHLRVRGDAAAALANIWTHALPEDPMPKLLEYARIIPDDTKQWIADTWGQRLVDPATLGNIKAQNLQRQIAENAMSNDGDKVTISIEKNYGSVTGKQVGDNVTLSGTFHGTVFAKVNGNVVYNDPAPLLQALADLRREIQQPGAVQGADNAAILAKLEELLQAVRDKAEPKKVRDLWLTLERTIMVGTVAGQVMQLVQGIGAMLGLTS